MADGLLPLHFASRNIRDSAFKLGRISFHHSVNSRDLLEETTRLFSSQTEETFASTYLTHARTPLKVTDCPREEFH